ncbi:Hypothetical predicted protein [Olea europaea subsp. europaea]|uniref:Uncharacterized protein n=1 Tax=Olea europaea subsp. europaea TaxID=158383 RepID=A0A8S0TFI8_OLEEU|nr:Hypothetical predicted protein [Olea europaea subsp. europaea]
MVDSRNLQGLHSRLPGSRLPGFQGLALTDEKLKSNAKNLNFSASCRSHARFILYIFQVLCFG